MPLEQCCLLVIRQCQCNSVAVPQAYPRFTGWIDVQVDLGHDELTRSKGSAHCCQHSRRSHGIQECRQVVPVLRRCKVRWMIEVYQNPGSGPPAVAAGLVLCGAASAPFCKPHSTTSQNQIFAAVALIHMSVNRRSYDSAPSHKFPSAQQHAQA